MALQLSPENQARITELLEQGEYPDADAVIARALDVLSERQSLADLREMIAKSADQADRGELIGYNLEFRENAMRSVLRRFAEGDVPNLDVCP